MSSLESVADEQHVDLTLFVQNMLKDMENRFDTMSDDITKRIDCMGRNIEELERSINDLIYEVSQDDNILVQSPVQPNIVPHQQ